MFLFECILPVLIYSICINGKSCIIPKYDINLDLIDGFNLTNFKIFVNQIETYELSYRTCVVRIRVNYEILKAQILFDSIDQTIPEDALAFTTDIYLPNNHKSKSFDDNILVFNTLNWTCSSTNKCHYEFLFAHIQWLIEANYSDLITNIHPLLWIYNPNQSRCYVRSGEQNRKCPSGVCHGSYRIQEKKYQAKCEFSRSQSNIAILAIETHVTIWNSTFNRKSLLTLSNIQFICEFNLCNSLNIYDQLKNSIDKYYNLSLLYQIMSITKQSEYQYTSTLDSTTINNHYLNSSKRYSFRYLILVLFIFLQINL